MTYELEFDPRALKEWQKLGETVKSQFKTGRYTVQPANRIYQTPWFT